MQMSALEIPIAFYGISKHYGNSHIWIEIEYDVSGSNFTTSRVFQINDGNYNASDFIAALNNQISPKNVDGTLVYPNSMYSYIEFSLNISQSGSGDGKVTIQPAGTKGDQIRRIKMDFSRDINGNVDNSEISSKIGCSFSPRSIKRR
jgi:hypothetical protein